MVSRHRKPAATDEKLVEYRRAQILRAAVQMFSSKGYHETTVQQIADKAGVSAGLIYHYIEGKHDILFLAVMEAVEEKRRELPAAIAANPEPLAQLIAVLRTYLNIHHAHRDAITLSGRHMHSLPKKLVGELRRVEVETAELIAGVLDACIAAGLVKPVDARIVAPQIIVLAQAWSIRRWLFDAELDFATYQSHSIGFLLDALLTSSGEAARKRLSAAAIETGGGERARAVAEAG